MDAQKLRYQRKKILNMLKNRSILWGLILDLKINETISISMGPKMNISATKYVYMLFISIF